MVDKRTWIGRGKTMSVYNTGSINFYGSYESYGLLNTVKKRVCHIVLFIKLLCLLKARLRSMLVGRDVEAGKLLCFLWQECCLEV